MDLLKSILDWVLVAISDYLHPEAKALRKQIEAESRAQDAIIEREKGRQAVLTEEAKAEDEVIAEGQAKLKEMLKPLPKVERTEDDEFERLSGRIRK